MEPIKIFHCISSLWKDGAQRMLFRLISSLDRGKFASQIINLGDDTPFVSEFERAGFPVHTLRLKRPLHAISNVAALNKLLKQENPQIFQGWMEHGNLAALFFSQRSKQSSVVWNIRRSLYTIKSDKLATRAAVALCAKYSDRAEKIVFCSKEAMPQYENAGFTLKAAVWIPNGFAVDQYKNDPQSRSRLRSVLGVSEDVPLVGTVGRFHEHKDPQNFLRAAAFVSTQRPDIHFVCIGRDMTASNAVLHSLCSELQIENKVHLLGPRDDIPTLMPGFDVFCSPSRTEGFPNVVGEAMACEVPCVVTDVGASRELVAGVGEIVPPGDPAALAEGILKTAALPEMQRRERKAASRERILSTYALPAITQQYAEMYKNLVREKSH